MHIFCELFLSAVRSAGHDLFGGRAIQKNRHPDMLATVTGTVTVTVTETGSRFTVQGSRLPLSCEALNIAEGSTKDIKRRISLETFRQIRSFFV